MNSTLLRLQAILREVFDDPALHVHDELSAGLFPEWDSVATVQIVLATEAEFGVRFTTDEVAQIRSVADLRRLVELHAR